MQTDAYENQTSTHTGYSNRIKIERVAPLGLAEYFVPKGYKGQAPMELTPRQVEKN